LGTAEMMSGTANEFDYSTRGFAFLE
ncbi:hypothetical protein LCGC14_2439340, partial [marine sediment metagenome]